MLLAATIPVAIVANAARVAMMGLLGDAFHFLQSWVLFLVALSLPIAAHQSWIRWRNAGA